MQTYIPVSGSALTCAQASQLVRFLYKKRAKEKLPARAPSMVTPPRVLPQLLPAVSTEPLPMAVALATGIENVPTRHLLEDTLFSCSLLILYPDLHDNATFSGLPKRDACIPPRGSLSCSSLLFSSFAVIFLISHSSTAKSADAC